MILWVIRLYIVIFISIIVVFTVAFSGVRYAKSLSQMLLFGMGVQVKVYGTPDPSARILAFNHPTTVDACVLNAVTGPISGLIKFIPQFQWMAKLCEWGLDCVSVGEKTTTRLRGKLANTTTRYGIAVNRPRQRGVGGKKPGDKIHVFHTMAFRLHPRVQPVVIVVDEAPAFLRPNGNISLWDYLRMPLHSQGRYRVYLLPTMTRQSRESPEHFARRTKRLMNRTLQQAWKHPEHTAIHNTRHASVLTSIAFSAVGIVCLLKGLNVYGVGWLGLMVTSILYHLSTHPNYIPMKKLDKAMVYLVVLIGVYYFTSVRSWIARIVAVLSFVVTCYLYYLVGSDEIHPFIHVSSIVGHLAIALAL